MAPKKAAAHRLRNKSLNSRKKQLADARCKRNKTAKVPDTSGTSTSASLESEPKVGASGAQKDISGSGKRLSNVKESELLKSMDVPDAPKYQLVDVSALKALVKLACCPKCSSKQVELLSSDRQGFARKFVFKCNGCKEVISENFSSPKVENSEEFDVNNRMAISAISIGEGYSFPENFAESLNIGSPGISKEDFDQLRKEAAAHGITGSKFCPEKVISFMRKTGIPPGQKLLDYQRKQEEKNKKRSLTRKSRAKNPEERIRKVKRQRSNKEEEK